MRDNSSGSSTNHHSAAIEVLEYPHDIIDMLAENTWCILAITVHYIRIEKMDLAVLEHVVDSK